MSKEYNNFIYVHRSKKHHIKWWISFKEREKTYSTRFHFVRQLFKISDFISINYDVLPINVEETIWNKSNVPFSFVLCTW